jgi:hypothetical protein
MLQKQPEARPTPQQVSAACRSVLHLLGRQPVAVAPPRPAMPQAPPPLPWDASLRRAPGVRERAGASAGAFVAVGAGIAALLGIIVAVAASR